MMEIIRNRGHTPIFAQDLAASRYDRAKELENRAAAPRAWTHPGLTAGVGFTDDAPTRRRPLFEVEAVYRNLLVDGVMERGGLAFSPRLPRLSFSRPDAHMPVRAAD